MISEQIYENDLIFFSFFRTIFQWKEEIFEKTLYPKNWQSLL